MHGAGVGTKIKGETTMTNQQIIKDRVNQYKELYAKKFGETPTSWWSYTKWLTGFGAGSFTPEDVELAKLVVLIR